jgi:hypothetical protein
MTARAIRQPSIIETAHTASRPFRSDGVRFLQVFAVAVMAIPSTTVIGAIGAPGYPGSLVGVAIFLVYLATVLLGFHNPTRCRHPVQSVLCVVWLSALASYLLMDRATLTPAQLKGADRFLIELIVMTGVGLVAAEWIRSVEDARRVVRVLCWGGAFCGVLAALQYAVSLDLVQYLRELPGFTQNHDNPATVARGSLRRATGTAITPIELGVVAGMLIPLACYLGIYDTARSTMRRWAPAALIAAGIGTSVSRSAIIAVAAALGVLVLLLPPVRRLGVLCALPFALAATFMSAHGLIGTLATFFAAGSSDSSIEYRLHDYPVAERLWNQAPWFGHGGGTYLPVNPLDFFDNQYLGTLVDLGAVGLLALVVLFLAPAVIAWFARSRTNDSELQILCAALAGAGLAAAFCSVTFDSLGFPMFTNVYALVVGLVGACWRLATTNEGRPLDRARNAGRRSSPDHSSLPGPAVPRRAFT